MKPIIKTLLQPFVRAAIAKRNAQFEDGLYAGLAARVLHCRIFIVSVRALLY